MKKRDLYDDDRDKTGESISFDEAIPEGLYCINGLVWIQNNEGEILLKRMPVEDGGKWTTVVGFPESEQKSEDAIVAEVKSELGVTIPRENIKWLTTSRTIDHFVDVYYTKANINLDSIIMKEDEVIAVDWYTTDEVVQLIETNQFYEEHIEYFKLCVSFLTSK